MDLRTAADDIICMIQLRGKNPLCADIQDECCEYIGRVDQAWQRMDWTTALDLCKHAAAPCSGATLERQSCLSIARMYAGAVYHAMGELEKAKASYLQSAEVFSLMEPQYGGWHESLAYYASGLVYQSQDNLVEAQNQFSRSRRVLRTFLQENKLPESEDRLASLINRRKEHLAVLNWQKKRGQFMTDKVPVIGATAAGEPILAIEIAAGDEMLDWLELGGRKCRKKQNLDGSGQPLFELRPGGHYFALRVSGDSMTGVGIEDGDYVIFRQQPDAESGSVVVVRVDDLDGSRSTVKRFHRERETILLKAENPSFTPQVQVFQRTDPTVSVLGVAVGIVSVPR